MTPARAVGPAVLRPPFDDAARISGDGIGQRHLRSKSRLATSEGSGMAKISDILNEGRTISFEFFPPRTAEAEARLEQTLRELEPLRPSYVSVTYGAGGSTRERTHELVVQINRNLGLTAMAHLTCAAHTRAELEEILTNYREAGIENVLALGGDPPSDLDLPPTELDHAIDLVRLARSIGDFCIGVAVHPEPHPRSPTLESDRRFTAEKLAEADFGITQFFFEPEHYFELVESLHRLGVDKPVIPGIMPVERLAGIQRMAQLQGSALPAWLVERLHAVENDPAAVRRVGIDEATRLCSTLLEGGAPGLHFYTLNRSLATREIAANLGFAPTR
jgi:methylenetetrahydrofolate reductase (NADPH)